MMVPAAFVERDDIIIDLNVIASWLLDLTANALRYQFGGHLEKGRTARSASKGDAS